jgi:hypothetical protein
MRNAAQSVSTAVQPRRIVELISQTKSPARGTRTTAVLWMVVLAHSYDNVPVRVGQRLRRGRILNYEIGSAATSAGCHIQIRIEIIIKYKAWAPAWAPGMHDGIDALWNVRENSSTPDRIPPDRFLIFFLVAGTLKSS